MLDFELSLGPFRLAFVLSAPERPSEALEAVDLATEHERAYPVGFSAPYSEEDE